MSADLSPQDREKQAVGAAAAAQVADGMTLGLGTGSTVRFFAEALGARIAAEGLKIRAIPTSAASIDLAQSHDIPLVDWSVTTRLDLCVDGADEVSGTLAMIKGGGGALLWEKIVAGAAARRLYIADASKLVGRLGAFPVPVEVVRFGHQATAERLRGFCPDIGLRGGDADPFVTDSGHFIYDCRFGEIADPVALQDGLIRIPGVVETGMFVGMVDALIAMRDGAPALIEEAGQVWWGRGRRMSLEDAPPSPVPGGEQGDIAVYHEDDGKGFARLQDPNVQRFARHWDALRGDHWAPARRDLDPLAIPWALPNIFMGDYEPATGSFRYRLAGREIEQVFERYAGSTSLKGSDLSDLLPPDQAALVMRRWAPLGTRGAIVYMCGWIYFAAGRAALGERLLLPLSDDGAAVSGFLGYTQCRWTPTDDLREKPQLDVWYLPSGRPLSDG